MKTPTHRASARQLDGQFGQKALKGRRICLVDNSAIFCRKIEAGVKFHGNKAEKFFGLGSKDLVGELVLVWFDVDVGGGKDFG